MAGIALACVLWAQGWAEPVGETGKKDSAPAAVPGSAIEPPKVVTSVLPKPAAENGAGARLGLWITEEGSVDEAVFLEGSRGWESEVLAAAKQWRFEPVRWQGNAVVARTELSFSQVGPKDIRWSLMPLPNLPDETHTEEEFGLTRPVLDLDPDLILPLITRSKLHLGLAVVISYEIEPDGTTDKIEIPEANSEQAVRLALDIVSQRRYKPGRLREEPVKIAYRQVLNYESTDKPIEALAGAVSLPEPAYPYERLLAGEEGYAVVHFKLAANGSVVAAEAVDSSHADFAGALVAAVEAWRFSPEAAASLPEREYRHDFALDNVPYSMRRLIAGVREGKITPNSPAGLDVKPKVVSRPGLTYPTKLYSEKVAGSAEVEFVIDRVGLAQLPHVLKASSPEFGWAAATLVNGMRFDPLTRKGQPVELRVRLPIKFVPLEDKPADKPAEDKK